MYVPIMISGTITDLSGRLLSGQTPEAFWNSVRHAAPLSVGLNCALGAKEMRAHVASCRASPTRWCAPIRTRACRTSSVSTTRARSIMASLLEEFASAGLVNIVGGCCGTTPAHIRAIAEAVKDKPPRKLPEVEAAAAALGARAVHAHGGNSVRERRRAHQRHRLGEIPQADHGGRLHGGARRRARPGRERRAGDRRQHGRRPARFRARDGHVPEPDRERAGHRARAGDDRLVQVPHHRGGPEVRAGQGGGELDLHEGGRGGVHQAREGRAPPRRGGRRHGVRREGAGRYVRAQDRDLRARLQDTDRAGRLPAGRHHLRSEHLRDRDRHRGTQQLRRRLHRGDALDPRRTCRACTSRAACRISRSRSAATSRCARRCTRCSCITPSRPAWTWVSSTPARWRCTTISMPELREACEDVVLNKRADASERMLAVAQRFQGKGKEAKEVDLAWREWPVGQAAQPCAGARHHGFHRRGHRGGAQALDPLARRDRRPADGRHERGRRPVRLGQDVPAAGGEVRARDEAGGRLPAAVHGRREESERRHRAEVRRQGRDGDREGRRARHRQEHRRRRAPVQQLRGHRSRRDGAGDEDPGDCEDEKVPTSSGCPA